MSDLLPTDPAERKAIPLCSGVLDYFPSALARVARRSFVGNEQHNPGEALHWSRGKSADHLDAALRHIAERDLEGAAWRILAALQMECEANGAPIARGAKTVAPPEPGSLDALRIERNGSVSPAEVLIQRLDATDDDTAAP